ncbi:MAG: alginate export family protein [Planctomycetota bacterium]
MHKLLSVALVLALFCFAAPASAQDAGGLQVGHWVRIKGAWQPDGGFVADSVEIREPERQEGLIGIVQSAVDDEDDYAVLSVMDQPIMVGLKTQLFGVDAVGLTDLVGSKIEVDGYWRDGGKFSARELRVRDKGRDRLEGRVDAIRTRDGGTEIDIMRWTVWLPTGLETIAERDLSGYTLAEVRGSNADVRTRDDDDEIPGYALGGGLYGGVRLEWEHTEEHNFDLDDTSRADRTDDEFPIRGELIYAPGDEWYGLVGYRHRWLERDEEDNGRFSDSDGRLSEAYVYLRDAGRPGLDLQIGRQDFDERREWLYDENLDGVRAILRRHTWRFELAWASILFDGNQRDEETDTWMFIAESEWSADWTVGAYAIQRPTSLDGGADPLHLGLRGYGEFRPNLEGWAELSWLTGDRNGKDLEGQAFDFGATWYPGDGSPWYWTAGYAFATGDPNPADGTDKTYRQTGLQDNNDKFGGVTSFRYYGELVDPELSNLSVATLGVGRRFLGRNSIDFVAHHYAQDKALAAWTDSNLDMDPSGLSRDLGWELDLVLGSRARQGIDLELVAGRFFPGDAYPDADDAWLLRLQVRLAP